MDQTYRPNKDVHHGTAVRSSFQPSRPRHDANNSFAHQYPRDNVETSAGFKQSWSPQLEETSRNDSEDSEDMQQKDPLGVEMWRFYRKHRQLPDSERMENMTWRLMSINIRKVQEQRSRAEAASKLKNVDSAYGIGLPTPAASVDFSGSPQHVSKVQNWDTAANMCGAFGNAWRQESLEVPYTADATYDQSHWQMAGGAYSQPMHHTAHTQYWNQGTETWDTLVDDISQALQRPPSITQPQHPSYYGWSEGWHHGNQPF